jgi:uncharacterized membrane protein YraQ (UPF0718 family)
MDFKSEWKLLILILGVFLAMFFLPFGSERLSNAIIEGLLLAQYYAREHMILSLVPAFFIAGAIAVFFSKASIIKYLGAKANKVVSYSVASISGTILAVCSCTVLPMFAGIYRMGAGLGPAISFLYSAPAINVMAIILTARILGLELGIARTVGAVFFSIIIGLTMHFIFIREERRKENEELVIPKQEHARPIWQNVTSIAIMVAIIVFANWSKPNPHDGIWGAIYSSKWLITGTIAIIFGVLLVKYLNVNWWALGLTAVVAVALAVLMPDRPLMAYSAALIGLSISTGSRKGEAGEWFAETWRFAKEILPLLFVGILVAGTLLGRPGHEGIIPPHWISGAVGGNSLSSNFIASLIGSLTYFCTLMEVPLIQGLVGSGMGKGPALALLLAGPATSLPAMLVTRSILGTKKTLVFISLVVVMATMTGMAYGAFI